MKIVQVQSYNTTCLNLSYRQKVLLANQQCKSKQSLRLCCRATTSVDGDNIHDDDEDDLITLPEPQHIIITDGFSPKLAKDLRNHFDDRFQDPLKLSSDRFCWDYWHVPGQYSLLRTPADQFFPRRLYSDLEDALTEFGENQLGCRGISPIWMSCYVDGHIQELHTDAPHGPWAFVLSISPWDSNSFQGGETTLIQPHILNSYWSNFEPDRGLETPQLFTKIDPCFGRLTVFDGRIPHGVSRVSGTQDPRYGRLVLHGWFTDPSPFFKGALDEEIATPELNRVLDGLYAALDELGVALVGTLCVRVVVGDSGGVEDLKVLTNTVVDRYMSGEEGDSGLYPVFDVVVETLFEAKFPESGGKTEITLPFIFR